MRKKTIEAAPAVEPETQTIEAAPAVELVKMVRPPFECDCAAPFEADVHPDEVPNYAAGGWRIKEK